MPCQLNSLDWMCPAKKSILSNKSRTLKAVNIAERGSVYHYVKISLIFTEEISGWTARAPVMGPHFISLFRNVSLNSHVKNFFCVFDSGKALYFNFARSFVVGEPYFNYLRYPMKFFFEFLHAVNFEKRCTG